MAIDPDVVVELNLIRGRLDALEAPSGSPDPTAPPSTGNGSVLARALADARVAAKVDLPQGPVEPTATTGIDAELAGAATWNGIGYKLIRDWDEDLEGRYLIFTKGQVDWAGHTLVGVHQILHPSIGRLGRKTANIGGGIGRRVLVTNPEKVVVSDVFNHGVFDIVGATFLDAIGDTWRPLTGSSITDAFIRIGAQAGDSTGKHYDGAQFHNSRNAATGHDRAQQTMRRIVFAGVPKAADGAPLGAVNSMIYFSSDNLDGSTVEDILVLDASGVWFPLRFTGTGVPLSIRNLQLAGAQGPPQGRPDKLAPTAFILTGPKVQIDPSTVHVGPVGVTPIKKA